MKIGIVISDRCPEIGGGFTVEQGIMDSLRRLKAETSHELIMVGESAECPACLSDFPWISWKSRPKKKKGGIHRIKCFLRKWAPSRKRSREIFLFDFECAPQVQAANLDLIVYLDPFVSPFLDLPYVINIWDLAHRALPFFPEVSLVAEWEIRERNYRERLRRAAYIISPNETSRQEMVDFYQVPIDKIRLLHHPTPNDALRAAQTSVPEVSLDHLGLRGDFLLYPAQFWPHKNHVLLLRMLKALKEKHGYEPQLVLTGADKPLFHYATGGNLAHVQQSAREMGVEHQVIFAGFVSREVLIALYRRATALVFPSFFGPENLPPLEAFALGCPVITADVPGCRDQYADAALQIDPKSPELWAEALQNLRQDAALRASLVAKGRARAGQFTSDDFLRGLFKIFDEFEAYRCNWTSQMSSVPVEPGPYTRRPPTWESCHDRPRA